MTGLHDKEEKVEPGSPATSAVRQVELWYKQFIDDFVQEGRQQAGSAPGRPSPITGAVLATAHEQAWRHAVVRASRSTSAQDWQAMTVTHEAAAYEHLLGWTAQKYRVAEDDIRAAQTARGYRHFPR